jgi:uncharacterized membrane protein YjjP (DUF1212 family)
MEYNIRRNATIAFLFGTIGAGISPNYPIAGTIMVIIGVVILPFWSPREKS